MVRPAAEAILRNQEAADRQSYNDRFSSQKQSEKHAETTKSRSSPADLDRKFPVDLHVGGAAATELTHPEIIEIDPTGGLRTELVEMGTELLEDQYKEHPEWGEDALPPLES